MDEEKLFNRIRRWMISARDFQIAKSAATFLLEESEDDIKYPLADLRRFKCYETTMVIAYARPFSMAKGEVGPLSEKDAGLSSKVGFYPLHQKLIRHRNTLFGHSDAEFVEMRVWNLQIGDDDTFPLPRFGEHLEFSTDEVQTIHEFSYAPMGEYIPDFAGLAQVVLARPRCASCADALPDFTLG